MSVQATGHGGSGSGGGGGRAGGTNTGTTPLPNGGDLQGVPPAIFDSTCMQANKFWDWFCQYKLVNRHHESMEKLFDHVLTALTYICGPMINDWVNAQEQSLVTHTDTTKLWHVQEMDEVLWEEFKLAFKDAWTDTLKKQSTYDQLMKLMMSRWDIDMYIATFEQLALKVGWALDTEGTIVHFRDRLNKMIHTKALDHDTIPHTMDEWKGATCTKVTCTKKSTTQGSSNHSGTINHSTRMTSGLS